MKISRRLWSLAWVSKMFTLRLCRTWAYPAGQTLKCWKYACDHDFSVVTTNARDFIRLLNVELHPGVIVFRQSGLTREEQWDALLPVIKDIEASGGDNFLVNKLVEILAPGQWEIRQIPTS